MDEWKIYPACLPIKQRTSSYGIHSGWSTPIPFHILAKYAPGFTEVYQEFFKQIHYRMEISDRCQDANVITVTGDNSTFRTNTYYPPGNTTSTALVK